MLVAALFIVPIFEYVKRLESLRWVIYGLLLISVMIFYPDGVAGLVNTFGGWCGKLFRRKPIPERDSSATNAH